MLTRTQVSTSSSRSDQYFMTAIKTLPMSAIKTCLYFNAVLHRQLFGHACYACGIYISMQVAVLSCCQMCQRQMSVGSTLHRLLLKSLKNLIPISYTWQVTVKTWKRCSRDSERGFYSIHVAVYCIALTAWVLETCI